MFGSFEGTALLKKKLPNQGFVVFLVIDLRSNGFEAPNLTTFFSFFLSKVEFKTQPVLEFLNDTRHITQLIILNTPSALHKEPFLLDLFRRWRYQRPPRHLLRAASAFSSAETNSVHVNCRYQC
jgi:hypothetical protein